MQQLNSLYRGDSSETLGQIMGGQYAPQNMLGGFTSNLAITGVQGAGATMRTAMQLSSQENIERRRLAEQKRQFGLTNELAQRQQYEAELNGLSTRGYNAGMLANNTRTTDFNTGGNIDIADNEAYNQVEALVSQIDSHIAALPKTDPNYDAKVAALRGRQEQIRAQMKTAKGTGRGGASGAGKSVMSTLNRPLTKDGKPASEGIADYVTGVYNNVDTSAAKAPAPVPAQTPTPAAPRRKIIRLGTDAEGNEIYGAEGSPMPTSPGFKPFMNLPGGTNVSEAPVSGVSPAISQRPVQLGPLKPSPTLNGVFNFGTTPINGAFRIGTGPLLGTNTLREQANKAGTTTGSATSWQDQYR